MKTRIIILFMLLGLSAVSFGQGLIEIKYAQNDKGEMIFTGTNNDVCDYFVCITFDRVTNTNVAPQVKLNLRSGISQVLKLTPLRSNESIGFSMSYVYAKGNSTPKINVSQIYLLPVKDGATTRVDTVRNVAEVVGKDIGKDWYALNFSMEDGDTVYAARTGYVSDVIDLGKGSAGSNTTFTRSTNSVEIFHADGTFARYNLFRDGGIFVKKGQKIFAGDAIGIIGKIYSNTSMGLMLYYLDKDKISIGVGSIIAKYSTFKPKFAVTEEGAEYLMPRQSYKVLKPEAVVTSEMSNREIKGRVKK